MTEKLLLYFDDTGSRDPDRSTFDAERHDAMDCFGLGGFLIAQEDVDAAVLAHRAFCQEHDLTYPLHSWAIRGGRGNFAWLKTPEKARDFFPALDDFLVSLPITAIACIVHRPGYVARYKDAYQERLWYMCKTAFSILIERSAKCAEQRERKLEVFHEATGKKEDRQLIQYMRELKTQGLPFSAATSEDYGPLKPEDFKRIVLGEPQRGTKKNPMLQISDLVLYAMAKAAYVPSYRPYLALKNAGKLIDSHLSAEEIASRGIKLSCFDS